MEDRMEELRLLLVEDDEDDYTFIQRQLQHVCPPKYTVDWAPDYEACIHAISRNVYDICLLDYRLDTRSGLDLLPEILEKHPNLPVIVLTGYGDYELDLQAMKAGAVDYLPKGEVSPDLLERSIRYAVERKRVERELSDYREHLERLVAERTEALEDLLKTVRRKEALLQKVLDALPVGVWITDQEGCIVHTNPAGQRIWGELQNTCLESYDRLKGWWLETGKPVEAKEWPISRAILNKETSLDNEVEIECFDGARKILLNSAVPIWDDGQGISGAIVVSQDITAQKRAERQIRYITRRLLKGQDSERRKLSHDLHEVIGQDLSALKIGMDSIVDGLPEPATRLRERVMELSRMLQESIMALRDLSYTLRPATLDQLGLVRAIEHYCEEFSKRSGVQVDFFTAGMEDLKLDYHTCITLYRLLHESLSNVGKYAEASTVKVRGELCTREIAIARKSSTIIEAARLMRDYHVGDLVVNEERDGERVPVGIVTDRDIVVEVIAKEAVYLHSLLVADIMGEDLMTAREEESLPDVLKRMCSRGIRRIPVVNERGGLEGILSIDDLIEQVCEEMADITKLISWQQRREREERV